MSAQDDNSGNTIKTDTATDPLALLTWDQRCIVLRALGIFYNSNFVYSYDRPIIEDMEERCRRINDAVRAAEREAEDRENQATESEELARLRLLEASVRAEHEVLAKWLHPMSDSSRANPSLKDLSEAKAKTDRLLAEIDGGATEKVNAPYGYITPDCVFRLSQEVASTLGVTRKNGVGVVVLKREGHDYFEIVTNEQFVDLMHGRNEAKP